MNPNKLFYNIMAFFSDTLWKMETDSLHWTHRIFISCTRLGYKLQDDYRNGVFSASASSLAYTTLLAFVPLLALSFALAKAFGVHNMLAPVLLNFLEPIGSKSKELTETVVGYVDKINVKVLGTVGLAFLLYTAISTIQQIETAFNHLWQIKKPRNFLQKFRDYLSVALVAPLLMVSSIGMTTTIMNNSFILKIEQIEPFGTLLLYAGKIIPYFLVIITFTMIYYLLPNTKVRFRSALAGGVFAGILWETLSWAFAKFLVSTAQYSAIYSGFALVLVFMIWLYFNWMIMLIGVKVAYYSQFPATLRMKVDRDIFAERFKYRLAVTLMYMIGHHHYQGLSRWTLNTITRHLRLPVAPVLETLNALVDDKIILLIREDMTYIPARDLETIKVSELFSAVERQIHGNTVFSNPEFPGSAIDNVITKLDNGIMQSLADETVKSLILSASAAPCTSDKCNSILKV
jgi:membrane protein